MSDNLGRIICRKRRDMGITQQELAERLHISFQAVSKWENGGAYPDIELLPKLAGIFGTTVDALLGYNAVQKTDYEEHYKTENYYWGLAPNRLCYEVMKLCPPVKPLKLLDIGCGEGKDAVFFARNGYIVTAFDYAETGIEKARRLAELNNVNINFFRADINDYRLEENFDIVFSSGVFHYIKPELRSEIGVNLKAHINSDGIAAINVFVKKPFISRAPDSESAEDNKQWLSGELLTLFHDWKINTFREEIFDCMSSGIPHQHCMDTVIAQKITCI